MAMKIVESDEILFVHLRLEMQGGQQQQQRLPQTAASPLE